MPRTWDTMLFWGWPGTHTPRQDSKTTWHTSMGKIQFNEFPVYCLLTVMTQSLYYGHSLNSWIPSTASSFHKPFQRHQLCTAVPFNIFQLPSSLSISFRPAIHADAIVAWQFQLLRTFRPPSFVSKVLQSRCVIVKTLVGFRRTLADLYQTVRWLCTCKD